MVIMVHSKNSLFQKKLHHFNRHELGFIKQCDVKNDSIGLPRQSQIKKSDS